MSLARVFLFFSFWSPFVQSANLQTDLLFFVPREIGKSVAAQAKGKYLFDVGNLTTVGDIPVLIENLRVEVDYQLKNLDLHDRGLFRATLELARAQARIDAIRVDHTVEQVIDGVVVKVRTQIDCEQVVIASRSAIPVTGHGRILNHPLSAQFAEINWAPASIQWSLTAARCEGPTSPDFLEDQLNAFWLQSPLLKAQVLEQANLQLTSWIEERRTWTKSFPAMASQVTARAEEFVDNGKAWVIRFAMDIQTNPECSAFQVEPRIDSPSVNSASSGIELQFNFRALNLTARCLHEMGHFFRQDETRSWRGFQELMKSRLKKSSVWPDLNRFPANANFLVSSQTIGSFNLYGKNVSAEIAKANPNSVFFNLYANIQSDMASLQGEEARPYLSFHSVARGAAVLSAKMSTTREPTQFTLRFYGQPEATTTYAWKIQPSNPKVAVDIMTPELMSALAGSKFELNMDPIVLSETHQINMSGLQKIGLLLKVQLQLNKR